MEIYGNFEFFLKKMGTQIFREMVAIFLLAVMKTFCQKNENSKFQNGQNVFLVVFVMILISKQTPKLKIFHNPVFSCVKFEYPWEWV